MRMGNHHKLSRVPCTCNGVKFLSHSVVPKYSMKCNTPRRDVGEDIVMINSKGPPTRQSSGVPAVPQLHESAELPVDACHFR